MSQPPPGSRAVGLPTWVDQCRRAVDYAFPGEKLLHEVWPEQGPELSILVCRPPYELPLRFFHSGAGIVRFEVRVGKHVAQYGVYESADGRELGSRLLAALHVALRHHQEDITAAEEEVFAVRRRANDLILERERVLHLLSPPKVVNGN